MDVNYNLMVWNISRHVLFIWKKMLNFKISKTIHNNDLQVKKIIYNLRFIFQNIIMHYLIDHKS